MANTDTKWAVIELGGKQHLVAQGGKIRVNQLTNKEGETLTIKSLLDETPVTLKVTEHFRGEKVHGLKFKNKVRYLRHYGHRQNLTALEVISVGAIKEAKQEIKKEAPKADKPKAKVATKTTAKKPVSRKKAA